MRRIGVSVIFLLALAAVTPAHAGYIDQYNLCQSALFKNRVREATLKISFDVYNEATSLQHAARAAFATRLLGAGDSFVAQIACSVATNATVASLAGAVTTATADAQQALVADTDIYNAISSQWNAYAGA